MLGATSGMRAEEIYQLQPQDIDIENKMVKINHNPGNGQTTKTAKSRVSFFTDETAKALMEYFEFYEKDNGLKWLFNFSHVRRLFKDAPTHVKDMRKAFSQTWDKRGGQTSIKKLLMGHSTRSDVDLMHYNGQNTEDLRQIYEKVMGDYRITP
jgi:integrase